MRIKIVLLNIKKNQKKYKKVPKSGGIFKTLTSVFPEKYQSYIFIFPEVKDMI